MKLQRIKSASDIKLAGIKADVRFVDNTLRQITLTDADGSVVVFEEGKYSGFDASVPAPPEMVTKFKLSGAVLRLPVAELFDSHGAAATRKADFEQHITDTQLVIIEVKVPKVDEPVADEEIPF